MVDAAAAGPPPMPPEWALLEDHNQGPKILIATTVMTACALLAVVARFYTRINIVHNFGRDDAVIALAMAVSLTMWGVVIPEVRYGAGRHAKFLDPEDIKTGLRLNYITQPLSLWAIALVKISIAFFLLRLAPNRQYVRGLWAAIVFMVVYTIACFFTIIFQCRPIQLAWDFTVEGKCFPIPVIQGLAYLNSGLNIFTDLVFVVVPIAMVWNARINERTKAALIVIMSLGVFVSASACVKLSLLGSYGKTGDFLWDSAELTIWSAVETNVGIIVACAPAMKPLFRRVFDTVNSYNMSGRSKTSHNASSHLAMKTFDSKNPSHTASAVGTRSKPRGLHEISDDGSSEESILRLHHDGGGIVKTTEVSVHSMRGGEQGWSANIEPTRAFEHPV